MFGFLLRETMNERNFFLATLAFLYNQGCQAITVLDDFVPECARSGVNFGAGVGALAGGVTGAAALSASSIGMISIKAINFYTSQSFIFSYTCHPYSKKIFIIFFVVHYLAMYLHRPRKPYFLL